MIRKNLRGVSFYEFGGFQKFRGVLRHAVLTRHSDIASPESIQTVLETQAAPVALHNQLHGTRLHIIASTFRQAHGDMGLEGDALATAQTGFPLIIRIADCASIMLFDPVKKVIANIHAGWRGLAAEVIRQTVRQLQQRFGVRSENLFAAISPMLGLCCSRFSNPEKELPEFLHFYIGKNNHVDLWAIVEAQLAQCGVPETHVENARICTFCHPEEFVSYRREGDGKRFATAIMLL